MFFVTWYRALVNLAGVDSWATLSVVSLVLALLLLLAYLLLLTLVFARSGSLEALASW